tara:strand:+ start:142 stop:756 length:615 start_codon:yes stop_codon:yes gene_type:complete
MNMEKHHYRLKGYYDPLLRKHGGSYRGMGWVSDHLQIVRFEAMYAIADISSASILDIGCGSAGFLDWLTQRGYTGRYTGIDCQEKMIELARAQHPGSKFPNAMFECNDFLNVAENFRAQYVFASGIFPLADMSLLRKTVTEMFYVAERGIAFNCLSSLASRKHPKNFMFADPFEVEAFCKTLTPNVKMRHDYLPQDFTVYIYPN